MACATLKRSLDWESLNQRPTKRRCLPFGSPSSSPSSSASSSKIIDPTPSAFAEATSFVPKLTPEKMAENIREEITRLHRRKQLSFGNSQTVEQMQDSESSGSEMGSPRRPESPPAVIKPDMALFTFKQVQQICARMLKEREDKLREQYDAVLHAKLAEQYDAFVKFTYDQIQRRYEAAPSYLS